MMFSDNFDHKLTDTEKDRRSMEDWEGYKVIEKFAKFVYDIFREF